MHEFQVSRVEWDLLWWMKLDDKLCISNISAYSKIIRLRNHDSSTGNSVPIFLEKYHSISAGSIRITRIHAFRNKKSLSVFVTSCKNMNNKCAEYAEYAEYMQTMWHMYTAKYVDCKKPTLVC